MIVVGVDGSPVSLRALDWAVREAELRSATVTMVTSFVHPHAPAVTDGGSVVHPWMREAEAHARAVAQATLDAALDHLGDTDVPIRSELGEGSHPGGLLVDASTDAELLVVGTRGRGPVKTAFLGSVSQYCLTHATCPVVVVPPADRRRP